MVPGFRRLLAFALGLFLVACGPEATPLPVNLPTLPGATLTAPAPGVLRYAVAPDALPFLSAEDRRLISAAAQIVPLDEAVTDYEIIVAFNNLSDATQAPSPLQISLLVNTALAPLDDPEIEQIVRWAVDPQPIAQRLGLPTAQAGAAPTLTTSALRADLANAGYPDGFDLTFAVEITPVAEVLAQQFAALGIQVRLVPAGEVAHLMLTTVPTPNAILLYTLPISYRAVAGLTITFTPSGFPIISR
ncbi:MAG: hypothetical protein ABI835_06415 [Chloroflexota bacterium]